MKKDSKVYLRAETLNIEKPPSLAPFSYWAIMIGIIFLAEITIPLWYGYFGINVRWQDLFTQNTITIDLGTALFIGAVSNLIFRVLFIRKATLVQGKVVSMVKFRKSKGACFKTLIKFQTLEGKTTQTYTRIYRNFGSYEVGQKIAVYYSPQDPAYTLVKNFTEQWFVLMYWGLWGLFLLIAPLLYSLLAFKK